MITTDLIVAGHICLDIIPSFTDQRGAEGHEVALEAYLAPSKMTTVGPAALSTGGAVSNTGLALHRLGVPVRLVGKVGDDLFGQLVLGVLRQHDPALVEGMIVTPGEHTSYSIVINPPGIDRMFLHSHGANDTFCAQDVNSAQLAGARLFHFGYPPIMRRMYLDEGQELLALMHKAHSAGLVTSLDMSAPDMNGEAGQVNWQQILQNALPEVDFFLPSLEETLFMLDRPAYEHVVRGGSVDGQQLARLAEQLMDMGAAVVMLKLGDQGLYLRTSPNRQRLAPLCQKLELPLDAWLGQECLAPCFKVNVVGTTGSGDCTIAGFMAALLAGLPLAEVMTSAVAVGACNVEVADAVSGVPSWETVQERILAGWERRPVTLNLDGWRYDGESHLYFGPHHQHPLE